MSPDSTKSKPQPITLAEVSDYCSALVPPRPAECLKMEEIAKAEHFPIIGPACGQACYMLARLSGARRVFELGSGYGYSTYWFARAVRENGGGVVHHTVWDQQLSERAKKHLSALGLADLVTFHADEAIKTLKEVGGEYDLMFCDIDKHAYHEALVEMDRHLRPGGLVIFDNMLLGGDILPSRVTPAHPGLTSRRIDDLQSVKKTTTVLFDSVSWISMLIPTRDGLAVGMKV